jgi:hypothetical protein
MATKKTNKQFKKAKKLSSTKTLTKLPAIYPPVPCAKV